MTRSEFNEYINRKVRITFSDKTQIEGIVKTGIQINGYYGEMRVHPSYYYLVKGIETLNGIYYFLKLSCGFKVSHIRKLEEIL